MSLSIAHYRARASAIAFSLLPASSSATTSLVIDDEFQVKEVMDEEPKRLPDPDVLPSLLAYKDGELEKTWIRVDWDVSEDGVEGLLRRFVMSGIAPWASMTLILSNAGKAFYHLSPNRASIDSHTSKIPVRMTEIMVKYGYIHNWGWSA